MQSRNDMIMSQLYAYAIANKTVISNEMLENIKNYSNEIITLESFVEGVRENFGMYIGYAGNKGFINMVREIFQNSIDELMKEASPCTEVTLSYDERNHTTIVEDNGRGIPFDDMIRIFTSQHTSSNYNKKPGEYSSGKHGVGSKVTNALSDSFIVESYILGEARRVEFVDGRPTEKGVQVIPNPTNKQGTRVMFHPTYEIMGTITTTAQDVLHLLNLILPLTKIGSVIYFNAILLNGAEIHEKLVNEYGLIEDLMNKTGSPLVKPITMGFDSGYMKAEIAFTYDSNDLMSEHITSYSNFCPTTGGTHVEGFLNALEKFFKDYMNKIYLANNKKLTVTSSDVRTGLKAIVSVSHLKPNFTGQAKEVLGNEDMLPFVRDLVSTTLEQWSRENSADLQKLCKYFKDIAEIRMKSDEGKVKLRDKYESSTLTGLPKKFVKPTGKEHLELLIVEGDSAAGSITNNRCNRRQGLFPIRGKIPNAFTTQPAKFLANPEIAGMLSIVGCGYGKGFDISKCPWEKFIISTDADPDGAHIRSLLLRFGIMYMLPLILDGRMYSAVPPLFGIMVKNAPKAKDRKYKYFTERFDFVRYTQKEFSKNNDIRTLDGSQISTSDIINLLYTNIEYVYDMEVVSNRYSINPNLLEMILLNRDKKMSELKKILTSNFRFIDVFSENGMIVVRGLVNSKYQTVFLSDKLIADSIHIIDHMNRNLYMFYKVNGEMKSLYDIMKLFEASTPPNLTRYKGLGEMDGKQLSESTIHPDSDRTLIRYTLEDAKKEIEAIQHFESNKSELIKDIKVSRIDVLG